MIDIELDKLLKRSRAYLDSIDTDLDPQIATLLHRYLCILLSSNIDKSIQFILSEFARTHGSEEVYRFVSKKHERGTNYNSERMIQALTLFSADWGKALEEQLDAKNLKERLDALYGLRNSISHGEQVNISRPTLLGYMEVHEKVIATMRAIVLGPVSA